MAPVNLSTADCGGVVSRLEVGGSSTVYARGGLRYWGLRCGGGGHLPAVGGTDLGRRPGLGGLQQPRAHHDGGWFPGAAAVIEGCHGACTEGDHDDRVRRSSDRLTHRGDRSGQRRHPVGSIVE